MDLGHHHRIMILALSGSFDDWDLPPLRSILQEPLETGCHRFILNLRDVEDVSDAVLGYVVKTRRACADAGGDLVLAEPSTAARKLIERHHLESRVPTFADNRAALHHLYVGGTQA